MQLEQIKKIIEALLFITDRPLTIEKIQEITENGDVQLKPSEIKQMVEMIKSEYEARNAPIELKEVAGGYQFATKPEYAEYVKKLFKYDTTLRISQAALETLSIIAYKQPITRAEIEEIRGVDSTWVLETLLEKKLIRVIGRKESIGRPLLYGTTSEFLRYLGLKSLEDLPPIESGREVGK